MTNSDMRDIVVTRILNAPVETVWKLWTDPIGVTAWWGPEDYTSPSARIDLREGGSYVFSMRAPSAQGGQESFTGGTYKKITPMKRLEFTQNMTDEKGNPLPADELPAGFSQNVHTIVEFRVVNGLTELTITEKGWTRSLMSVFAYTGMHQSLDKMAAGLDRNVAKIHMDMKLELVPLPVADVDRSKAFYTDTVGFNLDHDVQPGNGMRIVQLTPPGSSCSIVIGAGMGSSTPDDGTVKGLHLVVDDIGIARVQLLSRGAAVSDVEDMGGVKYAYFSDPDGNSWALQELGEL